MSIVQTGEMEYASDSEIIQAAVLKDIYNDIDSSKEPDKVSDDVIKDGYAPNSHYPANFVSRTEYPYSASIEDISIKDDGTLKSAKVRILQDLPQYAAVYVTAYNENNEKMGTIISREHIDNTSDKSGAVKELMFESDIAPHHFSAVVYYYDQDNNRLTDDKYISAVSPKYENRRVTDTVYSDSFSAYDDGAEIYGNEWYSYGSMPTRSMEKRTDTDGDAYASITAVGDSNRSAYSWTDLTKTITAGKLEISFKLRYKSGSVNFYTETGRIKNNGANYGICVSVSSGAVSLNDIILGNVNPDEWIDYKWIVDIDNQKSELYVGAYGKTETNISSTGDISQLMIDAASKKNFEIDIKEIKISEIETYDFTVKDPVPISNPEDMDEIYRGSLLFGGKSIADDDEGIFGKTSDVYLLGNSASGKTNWVLETEKGASTSANMYASLNIAMDKDSNALLQFGQRGPGARYQALYFSAGDSGTDEDISVTAGEKNRTSTVSMTLKPGTWYNVEYKADLEAYNGYVTVTDILKGEVVLTADAGNAWGHSAHRIYIGTALEVQEMYIYQIHGCIQNRAAK